MFMFDYTGAIKGKREVTLVKALWSLPKSFLSVKCVVGGYLVFTQGMCSIVSLNPTKLPSSVHGKVYEDFCFLQPHEPWTETNLSFPSSALPTHGSLKLCMLHYHQALPKGIEKKQNKKQQAYRGLWNSMELCNPSETTAPQIQPPY